MKIQFDLSSGSLDRLKSWGISNFKDIFIQWHDNFLRGMSAIFANTGGRIAGNRYIDGIAWEPLDEEYKARKAKKTSGGTLVWDGKLADSFRDEKNPNHIFKMDRYFAEYGAKSLLALWHQDGTKNKDGSKKMPARPIIFDSPARTKAFVRIFILYFEGRFKAMGIDVKLSEEV